MDTRISMDSRPVAATTRRLLEGPIALTLLRLAAPNVVMLVAQVAISVLEAYFVGWLGADALAGVVRGSGNMGLPAVVVLGGSPVLLVLSPALIFGWGPFPELGVRGAAVAVVAYYAGGALAFLGYLVSPRSLVRISPRTIRFRQTLFSDILRIGAPSLLNNLQTNLTVVLLTALVGSFGTFALAGYGMGARLE